MREIKFRVWDKIEKEMMLPAVWEENYVGGGDKKIGLYIYRSKEDPRQHSSLDWVLRHPEYFEVEQYAGIKDKKRTKEYPDGQEIYKGDKIKSGNGRIWEVRVGEYKYAGNSGYVTGWYGYSEDGPCYLPLQSSQNMEIIGNIHQNPEQKDVLSDKEKP